MEKFEGVTVSPGYAEGKIMYFCARQVDFSTETRRYFKLHILSRENGNYSIPNDSKKASSAVDGGEID